MDNENTEITELPPQAPKKSRIPRKLRGKFAQFAKDLKPQKSKWEIGFQNQHQQLKLLKKAYKSLKEKFKNVTILHEKQIHALQSQLGHKDMSLETKTKQIDNLMNLIERLTGEQDELQNRLVSQTELNVFLNDKLDQNALDQAKIFHQEMSKIKENHTAQTTTKAAQLGVAKKMIDDLNEQLQKEVDAKNELEQKQDQAAATDLEVKGYLDEVEDGIMDDLDVLEQAMSLFKQEIGYDDLDEAPEPDKYMGIASRRV